MHHDCVVVGHSDGIWTVKNACIGKSTPRQESGGAIVETRTLLRSATNVETVSPKSIGETDKSPVPSCTCLRWRHRPRRKKNCWHGGAW
jgi:hypothetical protein